MSAYEEEARAAFAVNRAIELYGAPCENFKDATKKGVARLLARLDMLKPSQIDMTAFISDQDGNAVVKAASVTDKLVHACNTSGCLAGWTVLEFEAQIVKTGTLSPLLLSTHFLGLTSNEANALFYPPDWNNPKWDYKAAKETVIRFWQTGQIKWGPD